MSLVDTHAHLHFEQFNRDTRSVLDNAASQDVRGIISVGTTTADSALAIEFVRKTQHPSVALFASAGVHPHEAEDFSKTELENLIEQNRAHIIAIGECGLDYYRNHSSVAKQKAALKHQLQLAERYNLPVIFHIRDSWDDFFDIFSKHSNIRGVIHSFTGNSEHVAHATKLGLYIALNGIMTFTKLPLQLEAARSVPLDKLLLETDCPYLSPVPMRGKRNEPANVAFIAAFLTRLRGESIATISEQTTKNAQSLFQLVL